MTHIDEVYHVAQGPRQTLATIVVTYETGSWFVVVHRAHLEPVKQQCSTKMQARLAARELASNLRRFGA